MKSWLIASYNLVNDPQHYVNSHIEKGAPVSSMKMQHNVWLVSTWEIYNCHDCFLIMCLDETTCHEPFLSKVLYASQ